MGSTITNDQRALLNIDFLFSMLFMLIIVCSLILIANERLEGVQQLSESVEARLLSETISKSIDESFSGGEGHEVTIKMPSKLNGSDYRVEVNQSGVLVKIKGRCGYSFSYLKRISNFEMNQYTFTMLPERTYTIRNVKDKNNGHWVVIF